jgi:hypothetical protein
MRLKMLGGRCEGSQVQNERVISAWESDTRPVQRCVVCLGPPDRVVDLPELAEVHVAFASSALCDVCAAVARSGSADKLSERASAGWADDPDAVPDVVRLVMAWAEHPLPAPPPVAAEHRHAVAAARSAHDEAVWRRLEPLMFDGPAHRVVVHGRISYTADGETSVVEAFRDGRRTRLSGEDGEPWLISDGVTTWRRGDDGMVASTYDGESWAGQGTELAARRTREDVDLFGFGTPIGPFEQIDYLTRPAWRFRFAAPSHKPFDMRVVVDDETGLVLEERFGDHSMARWTTFQTDAPMTDDLFTWNGPTRTRSDLQADGRREHEQDMARRAAWFSDKITPMTLELAGEPVEVTLHDWDDDGRFEASLDGSISGSLARRRRSETWWGLGWSDVTHKWSDETWDWALTIWDGDDQGRTATQGHITAVRRWLETPPTS